MIKAKIKKNVSKEPRFKFCVNIDKNIIFVCNSTCHTGLFDKDKLEQQNKPAEEMGTRRTRFLIRLDTVYIYCTCAQQNIKSSRGGAGKGREGKREAMIPCKPR